MLRVSGDVLRPRAVQPRTRCETRHITPEHTTDCCPCYTAAVRLDTSPACAPPRPPSRSRTASRPSLSVARPCPSRPSLSVL